MLLGGLYTVATSMLRGVNRNS